MTRFRTLRGRLTALATVSALVALVVLTLVFNVVLDHLLNADVNSRLRSQAAAAATTVIPQNGRLRLRESPDDSAVDRQVWIYEGKHAVERPPARRELQRAADGLAGTSGVYDSAGDDDIRLHSAAITDHGRQIGTVVTGQSLAAYDRTSDVALFGSLALAGVLLAAVFVLTRVTIRRALDPVREMTRSAAAWSEQDLDQRFGPTPRPDELGELARTFDALLGRVASSLRHEQRMSAELSHELRTPLSRIVAEIDLLQRRERSPEDRREAYAAIERNADQMRAILQTLMTAARADARLDQGRSDVEEALNAVARSWEPALEARHVTLAVDPPQAPIVAGVDIEVVERILGPLLDNAARFARSRVVLSASRCDGRTLLTVADDGPGLPPDALERAFEPGERLGEADGHRGAGLGLALARRLARAAGGDVVASPRPPGEGAELRVDLPA